MWTLGLLVCRWGWPGRQSISDAMGAERTALLIWDPMFNAHLLPCEQFDLAALCTDHRCGSGQCMHCGVVVLTPQSMLLHNSAVVMMMPLWSHAT